MRLPALLVLVSVPQLGGCATRTMTDAPIRLDLAGPVSLDVESFAGDVRIEAGADVPGPTVTLIRESTHGYFRGAEAAAALQHIGTSVEVDAGAPGPVVRVRTWTDDREPHFLRANLRIELPEVDGVSVRTGRGAVELYEVQGALVIDTADGDVRVVTNRALRAPVTVTNRRGDIDLRVRGESSGELDFHAVGGRVHSRIMRGATVVHAGTDESTLRATFNEGDNAVVLRTADGDIRFVVVADPRSYGQLIVP